MGDLAGGAALGAVFGELLRLVIDVTKTTARFSSTLNSLKRTLTSIEPVFHEIEKINKVLQVRKEEIDMFIERLEEGTKLIQKCSKIHCWNVHKRYIFSKKLQKLDNSLVRFFQVDVQVLLSRDSKKILVRVNDTDEKVDEILSILRDGGGGFYNGLPGSCDVPGIPGFLVGLEVPLKELKLMLLKDDVPVVVLSAPGGCGKTTLAKKLCHDNEIKGIFEDILFVTVSKTPNLKDIVQKLFRHKNYHQVPVFLSEEDAINQLEHLLRQTGSDRILLVLDDVWSGSESIIEKFMLQIPGFKILVTSRFMFVRFNARYQLKLLSDNDAMTLFHHSAFPQGGSSYIPEELVNKIVKGCGGFPLALMVVGGSLKGQPEVVWRSKVKKWSEGQSVYDSDNNLLVCLQTSLDALDDMRIVKECFLDLGSFPEDQRIPATALMDMWIELYNLDEDGVFTLTNLLELFTRNLVNLVLTRKDASEVEGYCDEHFVMLHDLLRELAIHHSNREPVEQRKRLIMDISGNNLPSWWIEQTQQPSNARLLSISTDETFSSRWHDMQLSEVKVLILNFQTSNYTLPQFMERMHQLKVLIITNYGFCPAELNNILMLGYLSNLKRIRLEHVSIASLNISTLQFRNLRKISLHTCDIGKAFENYGIEIPQMWPNLAEIDIDYCDDLVRFPSKLCELVHLKRLSMTYCHELVAFPEELGNLTKLEVLRLHSCTKLSELPESIGNLKKLRFLDISDCLSLSKMPIQMGELSGLKTLHMRGCHGLFELPPSVTDLGQLKNVICDEETARLWEPYESHFTNLKIKVLKEDANLNWLHNLHP